jgi:hypothetical protein
MKKSRSFSLINLLLLLYYHPKTVIYFLSTGCATVYFLDVISFLFKTTFNASSKITYPLTWFFLFIMISLFWVGISQHFIKSEKYKQFCKTIPSHLPALGILGTFIGIFIGLYNFDVNNLENSVPLLLEGMKLAFSTSIVGLVGSTVLRITSTIILSISNQYESNTNIDSSNNNINISDLALSYIISSDDDSFNKIIDRLKKVREYYKNIAHDISYIKDFTNEIYNNYKAK